jgi:hypothetical protein
MTDNFKSLVVRLRPILADAREIRTAIQGANSPASVDPRFLRTRLDRWIDGLEDLIRDADRDATTTIPLEDLNSSNDE